jgi:polysaccharide export outer membrane protein
VFHVPEYTRTVTIRADGYISLPVLGDVQLAGLSVPEADRMLAQRLSARLVDPEVTVNVLNPRPAAVFVLGEVQRPGPVPLRDAPTAALALANNGGILHSAAFDSVAVIHLDTDGTLVGTLINRPQGGETAFYMALSNMKLANGDLVVVPESARSQSVRFIQDFVTTPLSGVNSVLTPYIELRLLTNLK